MSRSRARQFVGASRMARSGTTSRRANAHRYVKHPRSAARSFRGHQAFRARNAAGADGAGPPRRRARGPDPKSTAVASRCLPTHVVPVREDENSLRTLTLRQAASSAVAGVAARHQALEDLSRLSKARGRGSSSRASRMARSGDARQGHARRPHRPVPRPCESRCGGVVREKGARPHD